MLETDRRVLANLSEPASLATLVAALTRDPHSAFDTTDGYASLEADVKKVLDKLVRRHQVVSLGQHSEAKAMLRAVKESDAIDVPKAKADALKARIESGRDTRLQTGSLYLLSKTGFDALHED